MSALSLKKKFLMTSFTLQRRLPRTSGLFASFSFQGALVSLVFLSGNVVYYATLLLPCQPAFSFAACAAFAAGCLGSLSATKVSIPLEAVFCQPLFSVSFSESDFIIPLPVGNVKTSKRIFCFYKEIRNAE